VKQNTRLREVEPVERGHGTKYGAAYSASKWGIIGLMKSAALELGEYGVTVNAIIPGLIDTALTASAALPTGCGQLDPKGVHWRTCNRG
jgi:NAD(P)-dependent dehydrogenase (short-subunit alcohol dehydrogenase family)